MSKRKAGGEFVHDGRISDKAALKLSRRGADITDVGGDLSAAGMLTYF
jgi:hypothetical protein